jgi:hypothetical protein
MSDKTWDDVLLSGGASVGKDKRDVYPTMSEQLDMIDALDPEEFEYVPSLPEQALDAVATPTGFATAASMISANPAWLILDIGSAVNDANQFVRAKLPTSIKKYWPETGDPWELTTLTADDLMSIPNARIRDMQHNPKEYAE